MYNIEKIIEAGGKVWEKGAYKRLYIKQAILSTGAIQVDRYNTGNISSVKIDGEKISNHSGGILLDAVDKGYIDLKTGELVVRTRDTEERILKGLLEKYYGK